MTARDFLAAVQQRADAATDGPWEADGTEVSQHWSRPQPWETVASNEVACMAYCYGGSARGVEREADAQFIAASRTDVPRLVAALTAALDLADQWREMWGASASYDAQKDRARAEEIEAVVTAALTPKENDS